QVGNEYRPRHFNRVQTDLANLVAQRSGAGLSYRRDVEADFLRPLCLGSARFGSFWFAAGRRFVPPRPLCVGLHLRAESLPTCCRLLRRDESRVRRRRGGWRWFCARLRAALSRLGRDVTKQVRQVVALTHSAVASPSVLAPGHGPERILAAT